MACLLKLISFVLFVLGCKSENIYTETTENQLTSPNELLGCKTKNVEIWSNGLYLRGTIYNAVFSNPSKNETIRCHWKIGKKDGTYLNLNNSNCNDSNSCHGDYGEVSFNDEISQLILNENFVRIKVKDISFICSAWDEECKISDKNDVTEAEDTSQPSLSRILTITFSVVGSILLCCCGCSLFICGCGWIMSCCGQANNDADVPTGFGPSTVNIQP